MLHRTRLRHAIPEWHEPTFRIIAIVAARLERCSIHRSKRDPIPDLREQDLLEASKDRLQLIEMQQASDRGGIGIEELRMGVKTMQQSHQHLIHVEPCPKPLSREPTCARGLGAAQGLELPTPVP